MNRETKITKIDGHAVRVTPHKATDAMKLMLRCGRVIGPGLIKLVTNANGDVKDLQLTDVSPALAAVFAQLDDDSVDVLLADVFKHTSITLPEGKAGKLKMYDLSQASEVDNAFTGRVFMLLKVFKYALEVNFGSFFEGGGSLADVMGALVTAQPALNSDSPPT